MIEYEKLKNIAKYPTGKLNSNAAVEDGAFPFFTCAHEVYRINKYTYDGEYVLLGGNNANGDFPIFYYNGKFDAYQRTYLIQSANEEYLTQYLFYNIQLKLKQMQSNAAGTATKYLTLPILNNINIEKYGVYEQRKMTNILSSYDESIKNNEQRIRILEQMAENLYREWFVRFRFPGYEHDTFEHGIPDGWAVKRLTEIFDVCYGKDHKKLEEGTIPVYGSGGIMRYGDSALYSQESVLIPRKGSLNNIMYVNWPFWTVDTMFYTKMKMNYAAKYMFYVLNNMNMASYNSGAALPSMTTDILSHLKVLVPADDILEKFDSYISVIFEQKKLYEKQNENLIKQRDFLLPRFMCGKLEVK